MFAGFATDVEVAQDIVSDSPDVASDPCMLLGRSHLCISYPKLGQDDTLMGVGGDRRVVGLAGFEPATKRL